MESGLELISFEAFQLFAYIAARCVGIVAFAPVLSDPNVSRLSRAASAFLLTILVFPCVFAGVAETGDYLTAFSTGSILVLFIRAGGEFLLGAMIGVVLKVFFQGVFLAGEMVAKLGGVSVAESFDATFGGEASAVSSLLYWFACASFLVCGGLEAFVDGFLQLFFTVPPGNPLSSGTVLNCFTSTLTGTFALGLKLCAPIVLTSTLVYLAMGINSRLFSQMNLSSISFNVNSILTLFVLFLGLGVFCKAFHSEISQFVESLFLFATD